MRHSLCFSHNLQKYESYFQMIVEERSLVSNLLKHYEMAQITILKTTIIHKMAVRAHAAASLSPDRTVFSCFLSCKSQCFCTSSSRLPVFKHAYSREFLLDVGRITFLEINSTHAEVLRELGLLQRPTPSPTLTISPTAEALQAA